MNKENLMNIKKTKYRYLMDNLEIFPIRPMLNYALAIPEPGVDYSKEEFFDRKYEVVTISSIKFKSMIDKCAKALVKMGVKKGDVVLICHSNTPETLAFDYALSKIGAAPEYVYPDTRPDALKKAIEQSNAKCVFLLSDDMIRKNVSIATDGMSIPILTSLPYQSFSTLFKKVASKNVPITVPIKNEIKWDEFIKSGKGVEVEEAKYEPNSVCTLIHTSGTTSMPKTVKISNENANAVVREFINHGITYEPREVFLQTIPLFVEFGNVMTHLALCRDQRIAMTAEMDPRNFYELVKLFKPNNGFSTPSHARELLKRPLDMSNMKIFFYGGDKFSNEEALNNYMKENGSNSVAYQGFALTESTTAGLVNSPNAHKVGSLGKPLGNVRVILVEDDTLEEIKEPNKVGEICITGDVVTLGYAGDSSSETEKVFIKHPDGKTYVHTGDNGYFDDEGFFFHAGRKKNIIIRQSFKFSPSEIVDKILEHPNVTQCVVVPKYSKEEGETPSAHIVLNNYDDVQKTMSEIISLVNRDIEELHRPTDYKIRKEILKTKNNKENILALRVEDAATMYKGVIDATIEKSSDSNYDYELFIDYDSKYLNNDTVLSQDIENFIRDISEKMKFNVGLIKYNINVLNLTYSDADKTKTNSKTYVKHIN